jgi:hypothetical protein
MLRFTLALALTLFVLGCGSGASVSKKPSRFTAQLRVTIWSHGKPGASVGYTLSCPSGRGTLPAARSACSKLSRLGASAFAPVPAGTACTEIYGGPQTAVRGRLDGETIDASFSRNDGCEIERWTRVSFLLPART